MGRFGMDLKEMGVNTSWIDSAQDRDYWSGVLNGALKLRVP